MKVNFSKIIIYVAGAALLGFVAYYFLDRHSNEYNLKILNARNAKDYYFKNSDDSPIEHKDKFEALNYFEPDPNYKVRAKLELLNDTAPLNILRNDGRKEKYYRYAIARFKLDKKDLQLTLLKSAEHKKDDFLFLPFTDETCGNLSYQGGRYLDLEYKNSAELELDFNFAYNPYCVYNYRFSCPLPPQENHIPIEIRAGEKMFSMEGH
ncbi:MAG TPA: DUF1684 domain-containing protein [Cytophagaceae bacterium]|jgi:hypothetical protein